MIVFFGQHEIIEQWREVIGTDNRFTFCSNYQQLSQYSPKDTFVVYVRIPNHASLRIALKLKLKGYKVAKFWAGTDSRYLADEKGLKKILSVWIYKLCIDKNLSPAPWLAEVLEHHGLVTDYWQSCSPIFLLDEQLLLKDVELQKEKKIDRVLVYSNPDRHWIYNTEMMLKIVKDMPHINFVFVGDETLKLDQYDNAESLGRIDQNTLFPLFKTSDVLLRITSHDGYSRMAIEAMYFGMHVITNWPLPHAMVCKNEQDVKQALEGKLTFNRQGYDYIREEFNVERWKNTLLKVLSS